MFISTNLIEKKTIPACLVAIKPVSQRPRKLFGFFLIARAELLIVDIAKCFKNLIIPSLLYFLMFFTNYSYVKCIVSRLHASLN